MKLFKNFVFLRNSWFGQEVPVFSQEVLGSQQEVLSPAQKSLLFAYYNVKVFIFL